MRKFFAFYFLLFTLYSFGCPTYAQHESVVHALIGTCSVSGQDKNFEDIYRSFEFPVNLEQDKALQPHIWKTPVNSEPLDNCPKFEKFKASESYHDKENFIKDVHPVHAENLPVPEDDMDRKSLVEAIKTNLNYWNSKPDSYKVTVGQDVYYSENFRKTANRLVEIFSQEISSGEIHSILKNEFKIYRAVADNGANNAVITGYYEAEIPVSANPDETHRFPLHLRPKDLIKITPEMGVDFDYGRIDETGKITRHYSREEISNGKLNGQNLETAWSEHPSHVMLVQIQGSGILNFQNNFKIKIGFDGANGWTFKSVQQILTDCGETGPMSFKDFIAYLSMQPSDREERLVNLNPRYIFFKTKPYESSTYGAMGYALITGRSIAIDPKYIPLGISALIKSRKPVSDEQGNIVKFKDFTRIVTAHDTGSAIRGPGRVDLFWGAGKKAEAEAGSMKANGEIYILIKK